VARVFGFGKLRLRFAAATRPAAAYKEDKSPNDSHNQENYDGDPHCIEHYYSAKLILSFDVVCREKPKSECLVPSRPPDFAGMMRPGHDQSTPFGLSGYSHCTVNESTKRPMTGSS
jgi:hypothetical protein